MPMTARVHPTLDSCLRVGIAQRDVLREAAEWISDIVRAIAEGWQLGLGQGVRHFLEVRHVLSLDLRHSIQLCVVDERRQPLMSPFSVDEIEDPRFCRAVLACARADPGRRRRRRSPNGNRAADDYYSDGRRGEISLRAHPSYNDLSARSFQRVEKSRRLQAGALRRKDAQPPRALVQLFGEGREIDRSNPALARKPLDFAASPQNRNVESKHLRLDRIIQQQLTGNES